MITPTKIPMRQKESTYSCKNNQERGGVGMEALSMLQVPAWVYINSLINLAPADKLKNEAKQEGLSL